MSKKENKYKKLRADYFKKMGISNPDTTSKMIYNNLENKELQNTDNTD